MQYLSDQLARLPPGLRTRFAPSPTGDLHLGHVASAIYVWGIARCVKADVIVRIEDHDRHRSRPVYEAGILEDLEWLGFHPVAKGGQVFVRQSDCWQRYEDALRTLDFYACSCSRRDILVRTPSHRDELYYDNHCRLYPTLQAPASAFGWRVPLEPAEQIFVDLMLGEQRQTPAQQCGDLLAKDRDGNWTYNFAVAVDDQADDISLVIRGQDILHATGRQVQLAAKLGRCKAPFYLHHPLIYATPELKLSKRDGAASIAALRRAGERPEVVLGKAAFAVGLIPTFRPLDQSALETLFR